MIGLLYLITNLVNKSDSEVRDDTVTIPVSRRSGGGEARGRRGAVPSLSLSMTLKTLSLSISPTFQPQAIIIWFIRREIGPL